MPLAELIYGCVLGLAAIEGQDLPLRMHTVEATLDRFRRSV